MNSELTINRRTLLAAGACAPALMLGEALAAELSRSTDVTEPHVVVEIADGKVRGGQCRGAIAFKGIPYAGPVSGAGRFKAAPPVRPWTGVLDALTGGTPAMQSNRVVHGVQSGEDCLFLNVWTPALDGKRRPVVFYNHGGGFSTGSANHKPQDGGQLAANHDVVVVASNHRLGIFGYLYLGEIGGEEYATSGNAGMLDIVDALKWVRKNIAAFGGDPNRVMVFGESGGGAKTSALLAMPSARGLFHAAGVMSGTMLRATEKEQATETARAVLTALNIGPGDLHKLADVPAEQLLARRGRFSPVFEGKVLSQHPFVPGPAPFIADIPLLIGQNRDEATYGAQDTPEVFKMDEAALVARVRRELGAERADAVLPVYRRNRPNATPSEIYIAIATSRMWGNTLAEAESKVKQGRAPVYMYRWDYQSNMPIRGTDWTIRAGHATDILAKFENADMGGLIGSAPDRFPASRNFGEAWCTFARDGRPSVTGAPAWPAYNLQTRATMLIDVKCTLVNDPDKTEREIWQATAP